MYFAYFQIGATITSLAMIGVDRIHHVSTLASLIVGVVGGLATVAALRYAMDR